MYTIRRGGAIVGAGSTLGEAIDAAFSRGRLVPGTFVHVFTDAVRVVEDGQPPADDVDCALIVQCNGAEAEAVWVYGPQDDVPPPVRMVGRKPVFLTDERVTLDVDTCAPCGRPDDLATTVAHRSDSSVYATTLTVDQYCAVIAARGTGDTSVFNMQGASAAAEHSLANIVEHIDVYDAAAVATACNELAQRLGHDMLA